MQPIKELLLCVCISLTLHAMSDQVKQAIADYTINGEKELAIIVPTYNNSKICIKNLESLLCQDYQNYHVYIINDVSTDYTYFKIAAFLQNHPLNHKVTVINNKKRIGAMANLYYTIHSLPDHVIVLNVDGDDWLPDEHVFSIINSLYKDPHVWLTYGQFIEYPHDCVGFCSGYPKKVIERNCFRKHGLPISHLRTYYAWLFKKIKKEDLMYKGRFAEVTWDKLMMVPMVEMCGGRFRCVDEILYVYNSTNPISDMYIKGALQAEVRDYVFCMSPYEPLAPIITDFAIDK